MKKIVVLLVMILCNLFSNLFAQSLGDALKYSNNSHASAMITSNQSKDALSILANPGLLGSYNKIHANVAHMNAMQTFNLSAGVVIPVESGLAIGFAFNRISTQSASLPFTSDYTAIDANNFNESGANFSGNSYSVAIGRSFNNGLNVGINMKAIQQRVNGQVSNLVPGVDVGITYSFTNFDLLEQTIFSASIENFSRPGIEIGAESVELPRFYCLGIERNFDIPGGNVIALSSVGYSEVSGMRFRLGVEYAINGFGTATIGWDENQQLCMGGKVKLGDFQLSIAQIYTNNAGYYAFSIGYSLNAGWF